MTSNRARHAVALVLPALLLAVAGKPAMAQPTYDKKIAKATADIVSQKLGNIRGTFGIADQPVMLPDLMRTHSVRARGPAALRRDAAQTDMRARPLEAADMANVRIVLANRH